MDLGFIFGRKKKEEEKPSQTAPAPDTTKSQQLHMQIQKMDKLDKNFDKRTDLLQKKINACREDAKAKLRANDKRGARIAGHKLKQYEKQLDEISGYQRKVQFLKTKLESTIDQQQMVTGMSASKEMLRQLQNQVDPETAEEISDELNEQLQHNQEVRDVLGSELEGEATDGEIDDDLAAIEREIEEEETAKDILKEPKVSESFSHKPRRADASSSSATATGSGSSEATANMARNLPSVPTTTVGSSQKNEDEDMDAELARLEAEMG